MCETRCKDEIKPYKHCPNIFCMNLNGAESSEFWGDFILPTCNNVLVGNIYNAFVHGFFKFWSWYYSQDSSWASSVWKFSPSSWSSLPSDFIAHIRHYLHVYGRSLLHVILKNHYHQLFCFYFTNSCASSVWNFHHQHRHIVILLSSKHIFCLQK